LALEVDKAHHGLRGNVPLFGRLAKPRGSLLVIWLIVRANIKPRG
jgi:hypothetical protein